MKRMKLPKITLTVIACLVLILVTFCVCVSAGSVSISIKDSLISIISAIFGQGGSGTLADSIVIPVRLPRVICAMLVGASLSLAGCSMQGLLRNPLADGSTLGVSSGAAVGAVISIAFSLSLPYFPLSGTVVLSILFAFMSTLLILTFSYKTDRTLSSNTIILIGIIFSMFASSITSLIVTFAGEKVKQITFWTMGSLSGCGYEKALLLLVSLLVFGTMLLMQHRELNAFSLGEENARNIGVNVKKSKVLILIAVSGLIGVCVAVGGTIGFVGLIIPHMTRILFGANHKVLLPFSMVFGSVFLMLCDLAARVVLAPKELPIGVITSIIGAVVFVLIFYRSRKKGGAI